MKKLFCTTLICLALIMPIYLIGAQEAETEQEAPAQEHPVQTEATQGQTVQKETAPAQPAQGKKPQTTVSPGQATHYGNMAAEWIKKIIGYLSQIGAMFGLTAGFRIGGTTTTGIVALLIAKFLEEKAPSWVKWALYAVGGTMFAGGSANIAQLIMQHIG